MHLPVLNKYTWNIQLLQKCVVLFECNTNKKGVTKASFGLFLYYYVACTFVCFVCERDAVLIQPPPQIVEPHSWGILSLCFVFLELAFGISPVFTSVQRCCTPRGMFRAPRPSPRGHCQRVS